MTAAELVLELREQLLRQWFQYSPSDGIKLDEFDQLVADLLACIDALKAVDA